MYTLDWLMGQFDKNKYLEESTTRRGYIFSDRFTELYSRENGQMILLNN